MLQSALAWSASLPIQIGQYDPNPPGTLFWIGVGLWATGFAFEAVGDAQLAAFRRDRAKRGNVLDSGLWRYTRHSN